ncbi:MAG: Stp1/IreP family PP2C-type Ser/Thr phosphatase [Bacteroidales bacterium]|nr:Stp1/IreP family PP2C-type Ser/Thr phosphatase [Bacteroidales bacterium]
MKDTNQYSYCNVVGDTDVGCKRKANEDWYVHFECKNGLVSVVCDGMGGHVGGAVASHLAVETIQLFLESNYFDDPRKAIIEACNAANSAILQRTSQQPELTGMGSTCVMLIVRNGKVYMGSVGDSRIYLVRSKTITQLTKDQSYVQMLVDEGAITKEQAEHHPRKNEITNALGLPSMQPATVLPDPINPEAGDCFLLCSDGLSGMVSDHEIMKVASNQTGMTQRERVSELIQRARKNGGLDNITCLIVEFAITPAPGTNGCGTKNRILFPYVLPCLAALLLLGIGGYALWKHLHPTPNPEGTDSIPPITDNRIPIPCTDTIVWAKNTARLEIEMHSDFGGAYIMLVNKKGETKRIPVVCGNITVDDITITPVEYFSRSEFNGRPRFAFNDKPFTDKAVTIEFKNGDSVYFCMIPVENAVKNTEAENNEVTKEPSKPRIAMEEIYDASKDEEEKTSGEIRVGRRGTTHVVLKSSKGRATNDTLYSPTHGIKVGHKETEWYSYNCKHGNVCEIDIINKKVPTEPAKAIISIPLLNTDKSFVIKVTR